MTETKQRKSVVVSIDSIRRHLQNINGLLTSAISQEAKRTLCSLVESLLMESNLYGGFNHVYWLDVGTGQWEDANCPEDHAVKEKFIIGPEGVENKNNHDWVHATQGEYARHYFLRDRS